MTKADIITMIIFLPLFAAIFSACLARDIDQAVGSSTKTNNSSGIVEGEGR